MKNKIYKFLKDKKVLILGFGLEGKSTYNFIRSIDKNMLLGIADLKEITDENIYQDLNVIFHIGDDYLDACLNYDVIIKGPGVIIKDRLNPNIKKKITSQTDLFLKYSSSFNIGITGTKGKSTTSSLLYHLLKNQRDNVVLLGNIGLPFFDHLDLINKKTICVLELGAHQLEYIESSPHIAVLLNLYQEHLDHYLSFAHYYKAKKNIYKYQTADDYVILPETKEFDFNQENIKSRIITSKKQSIDYFYLGSDVLEIMIDNKVSINLNTIKTKLLGKHNLYNIAIVLTIIKILNLDLTKALDSIATFTNLEHRLEYVGRYQDIDFYDDSIATSAESTILALDTLEEVTTIIIGGMERGITYDNLVFYLLKSKVDNIILLPNSGYRIYEILLRTNCNKKFLKVKDLKEAVDISKKITKKGGICLLSPAAASYGFYKDFNERGNHFQKLIQE